MIYASICNTLDRIWHQSAVKTPPKYSGAKLRELRARRGVGNYPRARERVHGGQIWSDARRLVRRVARII